LDNSKLENSLFSSIVANTPLLSIDLVIRNELDQVLLGKRLNRPARGYWFVPGGRILKGETMVDAFSRLTQVELGQEITIADSDFLGVYEHFYADNFSGTDFPTYYVVLAYQLKMDLSDFRLPKNQHESYR